MVLGLKLAFLAALWLFILLTGNVIRTDIFGRKVSADELAPSAASEPPAKLSRRARRQVPTTLVVKQGRQAGLQLPLGEGILIGRSSDCQLILEDDYVSTRHARISRTSGGYQVEDLGSTNGTFLNNQRVTQPSPFRLEDTIRIGRTIMSAEKS